ncbi:MAG TPA: alanine racemase [Jiangellales bacterium]|nr:alanine racemase [Jiangellales bacterium]
MASDLRARLDAATAHLDPPLAVVDLGAWESNAADLVRRAAGRPVRVASKSVRCRHLVADALARPGFRGVLAFTLAEALWLVAEDVTRDAVVGYPTADRSALVALAKDESLAAAVTLMVDDVAQLDLVDEVARPTARPPLRVCLELDASWRPLGGRVRVGARRSPVHRPEQLAELAAHVLARHGFHLVGLMAYEAQVAGVGDDRPGPYGAALREVQRRSLAELAERRAAAVAAVRALAPLEFVNGGGTGSVDRTAVEGAVTEVAAGSGLLGPHLFDRYRGFSVHPAGFLAFPVVRRPGPRVATVSGGGVVASGAPGRDRLPLPWLPPGLVLDRLEGAGEVQTPLLGRAADGLQVGDRVWFRPAKAGEPWERFAELHLVRDAGVAATVPTYRGEGRCFL